VNVEPKHDVARSIERIDPEDPAKYLFTSGSTGMPKAVIITQRMMCANVAMINQCRPLHVEPGVAKSLDWLPWNHVMGGNAVFNGVLSLGNSLYIDDGKPVGDLFAKTIHNLQEISPISYSNSPAGFAALAAALERDEGLCRTFFKHLRVMTYGGARLPDDIYARIQALAVKTVGQRIVFTTTFGATETAPAATMTYWNTERVGLIGLPCPGVELKLIPVTDGKYEVRIRGVAVTPGYHNQPDLTAGAFDEEGFYKIGDLVEFVDVARPTEGLAFSGRVVEDFKLLSGTFVLVGSLLVDAIAAASPLISDALVAGQDRDEAGLLAWPHLDACRSFIGDRAAPIEAIVSNQEICDAIRWGLHAHNVACGNANSRRIGRVMLLSEPPSIDGNEITDKGYINQRAGLTRRAVCVERLYQNPVASDVIVIPR
jgi:feruloyl-CoA synthase